MAAITLGLLESAGVGFLGGFLGGFATTMTITGGLYAGAGAAATLLGYGALSTHLASAAPPSAP